MVSLTELMLSGLRCERAPDSTVLNLASLYEGEKHVAPLVDAEEVGEPVACRIRFIAEALAMYQFCGGHVTELRIVTQAMASLPVTVHGYEYIATVRAGDDFDHLFRASDGQVYAVRPGVAYRRMPPAKVQEALASRSINPFDLFDGLADPQSRSDNDQEP